MKWCILSILILIPIIVSSGRVTLLHSDEYIVVYQDSNITIKHHVSVESKEFPVPKSAIYRDLEYYYNRKDNTYVKFK